MQTTVESDRREPNKSSGGHGHLTAYIVGAIVAAILVALAFPRFAMAFDLGGQVFLRLLQMVVVPLVMASVMSGILGLGDIRKLGRPGGYTVLYFACTTVLAVLTGLVVVSVLDPGGRIDPNFVDQARQEGAHEVSSATEADSAQAQGPPSIGAILKSLVLMLFTDNLLQSMVRMDLLPLIAFSIVFAGMLTTMGQRSETVANLVVSINDALMSFILLLMRIAPLGIFCLVAARFGKAQADGKFLALLQVQLGYILTVLSGLAIHGLVTLPLIYYAFTRKNPYRFLGRMSQSLLTAFSTASSTASLPVTMECAETKAEVSRRSVEFVLPLGATVNMNGTALYEAAAAVFIAQAWAVIDPTFQLTLLSQLTIAMTATLAAVGAAGIPEAGLVTMLIVLNAVGLPLELIGLILPVDWLLDRFRTAMNVLGDAVGAAVVDGAFAGVLEDPRPEAVLVPTAAVATARTEGALV